MKFLIYLVASLSIVLPAYADQVIEVQFATGEKLAGVVDVSAPRPTIWFFNVSPNYGKDTWSYDIDAITCYGNVSLTRDGRGAGTITCDDGKHGHFGLVLIVVEGSSGFQGLGDGYFDGKRMQVKLLP